MKGASRSLGFLISHGRVVRPASGAGNVHLHEVDSAQGKSLIFSRLKLTEPGPEYVHFPAAPWCDEEFAAQLGAERLETRRNKWGVPTKQWVQIRDRNEGLDLLVYATAALHLIPGMPGALAQWAQRLGAVPDAGRADGGSGPRSPTPAPAPRQRKVWRSSYLTR